MQTYSNTNDKTDELDLLSLIDKAAVFLKKVGWLIVVFAIAGILLGIVSFKLSPKLYSSSTILHSNLTTNDEQIQTIENWSDLLKRREYSVLGQILNCNPQMLRKLNKISARQVQKLVLTNNPNGFIVDVLVRDTSILDSLQNSIVYGLENNNYIRERVAIKKANYLQMIQKVKQEIVQLDSTKSIVENVIGNKVKSSAPVIIDISTINTELINLNEKLLSYEEELKFVNPIQVMQGFTKFSNPEYPKLPIHLFIGFVIGALVGWAVASVKYLNLKLKGKVQS